MRRIASSIEVTPTVSLDELRADLRATDLDEGLVAAHPIDQFRAWYGDAEAARVDQPEAMVLATAGADGHPGARVVLLRGFDERGFAFYTNLESAKGRDLAENPHAALVFHWREIGRQVRVTGPVEPVPRDEDVDELIADGNSYLAFLKPGQAPEAHFCVKASAVTAREYCTVHGLWKA